MFQWTFSQFWPLGLHSNQLKLWNITFWLKTQRKGPAVFHPQRCLISCKGCGCGKGRGFGGVGKADGRLLPQILLGPHTLAHLLHAPPFQQKPGRLGQASSNSGYRIYSVSSLSPRLSTIKRDFHERQECR